MKNITLLVMAAGIGSRFGGGIKQLEGIGPNGEIIMEYSVHDAIEAGFNKIVFVIRKDIEKDFLEITERRMKAFCEKKGVELEYVFQDMKDIPEGFSVPEERTKPWGTGHAVLAARDVLHEPFTVINADDYYGKTAYKSMYDFLCGNTDSDCGCMAGFKIGNTLSENGAVTRGICSVSDSGELLKIVETKGIEKSASGARVGDTEYGADCEVSMNMWGFMPAFVETLKTEFKSFLTNLSDRTKDEYLLPIIVGKLLEEDRIKIKVLPTEDKWLGMTYREDKETVAEGFREMVLKGMYKKELFSDIL